MKKIILCILPVLFFAGCSSDDEPTETAQNVIGKYDVTYENDKEYIQTFYLSYYDRKYRSDFKSMANEAAFFSICRRMYLPTFLPDNTEYDPSNTLFIFENSEKIMPSLELIIFVAQLNDMKISQEDEYSYNFALSNGNYFLVADIKFRVEKQSLVTAPYKSSRLTEWKIVKAKFEDYEFNGEKYKKFIILEDYNK